MLFRILEVKQEAFGNIRKITKNYVFLKQDVKKLSAFITILIFRSNLLLLIFKIEDLCVAQIKLLDETLSTYAVYVHVESR